MEVLRGWWGLVQGVLCWGRAWLWWRGCGLVNGRFGQGYSIHFGMESCMACIEYRVVHINILTTFQRLCCPSLYEIPDVDLNRTPSPMMIYAQKPNSLVYFPYFVRNAG